MSARSATQNSPSTLPKEVIFTVWACAETTETPETANQAKQAPQVALRIIRFIDVSSIGFF
jgi:hypothetical protein